MSKYMSTLMSNIWVLFCVKTWVLSVFKSYFKYNGKIWVLMGLFLVKWRVTTWVRWWVLFEYYFE